MHKIRADSACAKSAHATHLVIQCTVRRPDRKLVGVVRARVPVVNPRALWDYPLSVATLLRHDPLLISLLRVIAPTLLVAGSATSVALKPLEWDPLAGDTDKLRAIPESGLTRLPVDDQSLTTWRDCLEVAAAAVAAVTIPLRARLDTGRQRNRCHENDKKHFEVHEFGIGFGLTEFLNTDYYYYITKYPFSSNHLILQRILVQNPS